MTNKKHYILTSITLGSIAAVAAGIIGLTNFLTKDKIKENELQKIKSGISEIFGENAEIESEFQISDKNFSYVIYGYKIKNDESTFDKYALRTSGFNTYGKISLLIGVVEQDNESHDYDFSKLTIINNEQTYASTLEDEYLDPLNEGKRDKDDVKCGATYGAKLVRDMIYESINYANSNLKE